MTIAPDVPGRQDGAPIDSMIPPGSRGVILLVEDESSIRTLIARTLERESFIVLEARNGQEALKKSLEYNPPIHLLITDVTMPLLSGPELVRQIHPLRPSMKVIFVTGREKKDVDQGPGVSYLEKPFTIKGLLAQVKQVLG